MAAPAALRNSTGLLVGYARRDLSALWRDVNTVAQAQMALMDILPALIETYGAAAATLAATWYDDAREKAAVRGSFQAIPIEPGDRGAQALAGWATSTATSVGALEALILGGIQRRIADHSRLTVTSSSTADPAAGGWVRVGTGACKSGWCDQFLDGEVRSVAYDFPAHDNCNCHAIPDWF